jgi:hypothetical protein
MATTDLSFVEQLEQQKQYHKTIIRTLPAFAVPVPELGSSSKEAPPDIQPTPIETLAYLARVMPSVETYLTPDAPATKDAPPPDVENLFSDLKADGKTSMQQVTNDAANAANSGAQQVKAAPDQTTAVNTFTQQMNAQRDQTKANVDAKIDEWYAKAEATGQNLPPGEQQLIVNGMQTLVQGSLSILSGIGNALLQIASIVLNILNDIWGAISGAFGPVVSAIASLF